MLKKHIKNVDISFPLNCVTISAEYLIWKTVEDAKSLEESVDRSLEVDPYISLVSTYMLFP